jgi:hypothetical protein
MLCVASTSPRRPPRQKKAKWTSEEDDLLRSAVQAHGTDSWCKISALVPNRTGKQCRERWLGQLSPAVSREIWSAEEDAMLIHHQSVSGNKWALIAAEMPGRTSLHVKNRWNWLVRRQAGAEDRARAPDVVERRSPQTVFEPLQMNSGLFGPAFQAFQETMFR